jgi:hypothetical protein
MKGVFLRMKALYTKDEKKGTAYLAEANLLRDNAAELRKSGKGQFSGAPMPDLDPAPPPTPPSVPISP